METRSVIYQHHQIGYQVAGNGNPVMLVHGFGEDSSVWAAQISSLQENFRIYIPDLPGTGISAAALEAEKEWSMEKFALVLREIALKEHLNTFTLLGHSLGGYITLAFAELYPDLLNGFGLIHSSAFADNEEKIAARKKGIEFIRTQGASKFIDQLVPNLYGEVFKSSHPEDIRKHIEDVSGFSAESLISYYQAMINRPDRTQVLSNSRKPVLFIIGAEDKIVNLSDSLAQCHLPAESHVSLLKTSAHMGMREEPEKTTSAIQDFLLRLNEN